MEWGIEFADYLPHSPKSPDEVAYNRQLINQLTVNYEAGLYDFTVLACHLLTMRAIYYKLWQSNQADPAGFQTVLLDINDRNKNGIGNEPNDFSKIREKNAAQLLKTLNHSESTIAIYVEMVDERNNIAHSSGQAMFNSAESTNERLSRGLETVKITQQCSTNAIREIYTRFIKEIIRDPEYDVAETEILVEEKLIKHHHLSLKDIEVCQEHRLTEIFRGEVLRRAEAIQAFLTENYR